MAGCGCGRGPDRRPAGGGPKHGQPPPGQRAAAALGRPAARAGRRAGREPERPAQHEEPVQPGEPEEPGVRQEPAGREPVPAATAPRVQAAEPALAGESAPAAAGTGLAAAGPRITAGTVRSRYAGAMLLHAFGGQVDADAILAAAGGAAGARYEDTALLSAVSCCFALGAVTIEQFKHLAAGAAGPLAGLAALPGLRTLRPRLAAIADRTDPLELQSAFAPAMLAAGPVTSGVYYVDDHFVPYTGARPAGKGWNNKRGRAEKGRADTHVTAHDGRAVCFVSGDPSGLTVTLPKALAELTKAAGPGAKILLGFDRGGACAQVFRHCREEDVHWVTWRRAPLAVPAMLPVLAAITVNGQPGLVAWAGEMTHIKDYGDARQITLFEHGQPALRLLTSDADACPAGMLSFLKSRWREENFLKYAPENYGIDKICDYAAAIEVNTKVVDNPGRKAATARVRAAEKVLAAERESVRGDARRPGHPRGGQERGADPGRAEEYRPGRAGRGRRQGRPRPGPRQAPGERHRPVRAGRGAARRAARPADGAAAARAQRRALARHPPQRIPA